jgi:hypothetical protein
MYVCVCKCCQEEEEEEEVTALQMLALKHARDKELVQQIRRDLRI